MNKKVAIVQSNYIPWKGYFDLINMADEFILYDSVQYTRRDWRNRNKIKTQNGVAWITIPVEVKGKYFQSINETKISDSQWNVKHWQLLIHNYSKAKYFKSYKDIFREEYEKNKSPYLSQVNYNFIKNICEILEIKTKISFSMDYNVKEEGKTEKLLCLCKQAGATEYISGPSAKDYLDPQLFDKEKIKLSFIDYSGYLEYKQLFPPFEHAVTILDLIFNEGPNAKKYMKSFFGVKTRIMHNELLVPVNPFPTGVR